MKIAFITTYNLDHIKWINFFELSKNQHNIYSGDNIFELFNKAISNKDNQRFIIIPNKALPIKSFEIFYKSIFRVNCSYISKIDSTSTGYLLIRKHAKIVADKFTLDIEKYINNKELSNERFILTNLELINNKALLNTNALLFINKSDQEYDLNYGLKSTKLLIGPICNVEMKKISKGWTSSVFLTKINNQNRIIKRIPFNKKSIDDYYFGLAKKEVNVYLILQRLKLSETSGYIHFPDFYKYQICEDIKRFMIMIEPLDISLTEYINCGAKNEQIMVILFQLLASIKTFNKLKLFHLDLHIGNIMLRYHPKDNNDDKRGYYKYIIDSKEYYIPNIGLEVVLIDFGNAEYNVMDKSVDLNIFRDIEKYDLIVEPEKQQQYLMLNYTTSELESFIVKYRDNRILKVLKSKNYATKERYKLGAAKRLIGDPFYKIYKKNPKEIKHIKINSELKKSLKSISKMDNINEIINKYFNRYLVKKDKNKIDKIIFI